MLRILVCDDAGAYTTLLAHWIGNRDDMCVVATTGRPDEAERLAREHDPDIIVLDHMLGQQVSDHTVPALRTAAPNARILLISGMPGDDLAGAAAVSRPDGFISKASGAEAFCAAVHATADRAAR